ncbi:glycoside hydrolase family 26 protein [Streptomyces sp. NPDC101160]|uniref:glycoside hydrolase family 26 protein n=1 Tax=Streptomyces sp. NPDC101160 TaxID=3366118 RepID=UPI0038191C1D
MNVRPPRLRPMRAALPLAALLLALTACTAPDPGGRSDANPGPQAAPQSAPEVPYDVRPLIRPAKKYFGVSTAGAPTSMKPVDAYTRKVGKRPNLISYYAAWGDGFDITGVRNAWQSGALTVVSWEPFEPSLEDIAAGKSDDYIRSYARAVRKLNLPVAITFADEMNGAWETWGTERTTPEAYVRAWRHIHQVFQDVGAANVIWAWSPNVINPVKDVPLRPYYPGDAYVDWVGLIGYFTYEEKPDTFGELFGPTMREIRGFSAKPFILLETAAERGWRRDSDVRALLTGVAADPEVIGFVWFDHAAARADWRLDEGATTTAEFTRLAADDIYGFDVRKVR